MRYFKSVFAVFAVLLISLTAVVLPAAADDNSNVTVTAQPQGGEIKPGEPLTLSVTAEVTTPALGGDYVLYQWYDEDGAIEDAIEDTYQVKLPGTYYVEVKSSVANGWKKSNDAVVTMVIGLPVTKTVAQGGSLAPGEETFRFELFDLENPDAGYALNAEIKTDGTGSFDGTLELRVSTAVDFERIWEGFSVREITETKSGWAYSGAVWYASAHSDAVGNFTGYSFCEVIDGERQSNFQKEKMMFTNTYTANLSAHAVTVQNDGNGTASASTVSATAGTEVTLTAAPKEGYRFKQWEVVSGGVTVTGGKFTMPDNAVTIKAIFEPIPTYTVTVQNDGNGTASARPPRPQPVRKSP
jgi:hypothetical protein